MSETKLQYGKAVVGALLGVGVQLASALALLLTGLQTAGPAVLPAAWFAFGALLPWVVLLVLYHQHRLEREEALEAERLGMGQVDEARLFDESDDELNASRKRLRRLYNLGLPLAGVVTGVYLLALGIYGMSQPNAFLAPVTGEPFSIEFDTLRWLAVAAGVGFMNFLVSRYLSGLSKVQTWQLLRSGAGLLMGNALLAALIAAAFALAHVQHFTLLKYLPSVLPVLLVIISLEMLLNLLLNVYRPRRRGEILRPAFDSRLLGLLTTPEGLASTLSEAINYQFGFEITHSWFWKLLARVTVPLLLFGMGTLLLASSIVIVQPHQQALVLRFGRVASEKPLDPGLHFKWPWPIETARAYDATRVRELVVGSHAELHDREELTSILWTNMHAESEHLLIVAPPEDLSAVSSGAEQGPEAEGSPSSGKAPSVSLLAAEVHVYYRVRDLMQWVSNQSDPEMRFQLMTEAVVARHMLRYDIDTWLGRNRSSAAAELKERIQRAADEAQIGIEVLTVGTSGIHPPQEVASAFHETLRARQERETFIQEAQKSAIQTLAGTAGSSEWARALNEELSPSGMKSEDEAHAAKIEAMVLQAGGKAARELLEAKSYRWERENDERARAERFLKRVEAHMAAPRLYRMRRYLQVLEASLAQRRKYLLLAERENLVIRMDFKTLDNELQDLNLTGE